MPTCALAEWRNSGPHGVRFVPIRRGRRCFTDKMPRGGGGLAKKVDHFSP